MGVSIEQWRNAIGCNSCNFSTTSNKTFTSTETLSRNKSRIFWESDGNVCLPDQQLQYHLGRYLADLQIKLPGHNLLHHGQQALPRYGHLLQEQEFLYLIGNQTGQQPPTQHYILQDQKFQYPHQQNYSGCKIRRKISWQEQKLETD